MEKEYSEIKDRTAQALQTAASRISSLNSVIIDRQLKEAVDVEPIRESPTMQDFLDAPMTGQKSADVKKLMAAAMYISGNAKDMEPTTVAAASDEALDRIKTAYKVAKGEIEIEDATDYLVDKAAAKVKTVACKFIDKAAPVVVNTVCSAVESVFPPAKIVTPIIRMATPVIAGAVKTVVNKGIEIVANAAKTVARAIVGGVKKLFNWLFG